MKTTLKYIVFNMTSNNMTLPIILLIGAMFMLQACVEKSITSIVHPKVLSVPIKEINEPLIDLRDQTIIWFGDSPEILNNQDYTKIRRTVYEKLITAQKLLPKNLRFCLYEGYRSLALQEKLYNDRYHQLKNDHPEWNHLQLFQETTKLVSPIVNLDGSHNIPPHSTGAAIDIYLVDSNKIPVDMGINVADWMQDSDGSLSQTHSAKISRIAQRNRTIMSHALHSAGFINYSGEYWHWSYGDRYWAYHVGNQFALYGTVK